MHKISFDPKYTIKFVAFAAEEIGFHGSQDFAAKAAAGNDGIVMMLNNDMIAGIPVPPSPPWYVNIINYENSASLANDAKRRCFINTTLEYFTDNSLGIYSDSYPFYLNGYKAVFFVQKSLGDFYHTVNDLPSNCNFTYCREVAKISCAMLLEKNY